ncbi:hypothetical protein ACIP3A_39295 [Streptomyces tricolor]|uniref:hypothetical protein n=1 Tax=Streptomyces tricolor TaxID=68277 RepID=UPI003820356C
MADITSCAGPAILIIEAEKHLPAAGPFASRLALRACTRPVPCDGTNSKILSRLTGALGAFASDRDLSTGDLIHGRWMNLIATSVWADR